MDDQIAMLENTIRDMHIRLDEAKAQLRAMKTHRNTLVPFCQLPADILYQILHILAQSNYQTEIVPRGHQSSAPWTRTMATCTHLRELCLAAPSLWAYVDGLSDLEWMKLSSERSGTSPLILRVGDDSEDARALLATHPRRFVIPSLLPRIADVDLTVHGPSSTSMWIAHDILERPMPLLVSLCLRSAQSFRGQHILSSKFLVESAPRLKKLVMTHVYIEPGWAQPCSLTYLLLDQAMFQPQGLADLLEHVPYLAYLELIIAQLLEGPVPLPISLPNLRILRVRSIPPFLAKLLSFLPAPVDMCQIECQASIQEIPQMDTDEDRKQQRAAALAVLPRLFARTRFSMRDAGNRALVASLLEMDVLHASGGVQCICRLLLSAPGRGNEVMDFVDYSATVRGHVDVLGEARELHVQGMFVGPLCSWAAESPTLRLSNVDALVIESGRGGIPELESWLEGRVAAGCIAPDLNFTQCVDYGSIEALGKKLVDKGLAPSVFQDGHLLCGQPRGNHYAPPNAKKQQP
jgi:hypothetical protein